MDKEPMGSDELNGNDSSVATQAEELLERNAAGGMQGRGEISAAALGRMLGLATAIDVHLLESKIDLLASKLNQVIAKMERVMTFVTKAPTGADLERIDVQIGSLKATMYEFVSKHALAQTGPAQTSPQAQMSDEPSTGQDEAEAVKQADKTEDKTPEASKKRVTLSSLDM